MNHAFAAMCLLAFAFTLGCASKPPNAALKPTTAGWHCTNAIPMKCWATAEACTASEPYRCAAQPQAWCFTWASDGTPDSQCLASESECKNQREIRMTLAEGEAARAPHPKFTDWSGCGVW